MLIRKSLIYEYLSLYSLMVLNKKQSQSQSQSQMAMANNASVRCTDGEFFFDQEQVKRLQIHGLNMANSCIRASCSTVKVILDYISGLYKNSQLCGLSYDEYIIRSTRITFCRASIYRNFDAVETLYRKMKDLDDTLFHEESDLHTTIDVAFITACACGRKDAAEFILKLAPDVDFSLDMAYLLSAGRPNVLNWLSEIVWCVGATTMNA